MISISMTESDINGHVLLEEGDSELGRSEARVNRYATLDGGSVIVHSGVAQSDRTFRMSTRVTKQQSDIIEYIYENSIFVNVSCTQGVFLGTISEIELNNGTLVMIILIKERVV